MTSEVRAPKIRREARSRPKRSVPSQNWPPGGNGAPSRVRPSKLCSNGSCGHDPRREDGSGHHHDDDDESEGRPRPGHEPAQHRALRRPSGDRPHLRGRHPPARPMTADRATAPRSIRRGLRRPSLWRWVPRRTGRARSAAKRQALWDRVRRPTVQVRGHRGTSPRAQRLGARAAGCRIIMSRTIFHLSCRDRTHRSGERYGSLATAT